jgi:hypothetical protein
MGKNLRQKVWLDANGNKTEAPPARSYSYSTYSSAVLRDSVGIALLVAALNDLKLLSCNIQNAYLSADC